MAERQRISLAPLMGTQSRLVSDRTLGGTYMRGGYNVELRDGEWWSRKGEEFIAARLGSTPWRWIFDVNRDLTIICNEFYALQFSRSTQEVAEIYTVDATESVTFTNASTAATSTTLRTVGQLLLVGGSGFTDQVYRVTAASGSGPYSITLERAYEGGTGAINCRFIDPIARTTAGATTSHSTSIGVGGSAVLFEQLVTHSSTAIHAASPAVTAGNTLLIITSNRGVPVAIDVSNPGSPSAIKRSFFYNTALATPAVIGSDTEVDDIRPRGLWASVYKGRLFIAAAADPSGDYGSRTVWYSAIGDILNWHTGIAGQTAAPNFITVAGEANSFCEMKNLQDDLVIHREDSQTIISATGSAAQPFTVRENNQGIGLRAESRSNRVVVANGVHFMWSNQGLAIFDGRQVTPIARQAYRDWISMQFLGPRSTVRVMLHDVFHRRIYAYSAAGIRHPSATAPDNYIAVFVYDYENDAFWWEDRPPTYGGGFATIDTGQPQVLCASRIDGTIVGVMNRTYGTDADVTTPETQGSDIPVYAQVETPWLDFGSLTQKQLCEVEVTLRGGFDLVTGYFDRITDVTGNLWLRCIVYGDMDRTTAKGSDGAAYTTNNTIFDTTTDNRQPPTALLTLTPRAHARQFKLVFTNVLTSAATTAGYERGPFRISDIQCEFDVMESTQPRKNINVANIAE